MIDGNALISVVVPIYNVEPYLRRCVNSILCQSYKKLEIILVDDGSQDNCGLICDEYANNTPNIKVVHKKNGGLSDARNAGVLVSNGEYIAFVDSDDYIAPNYIEYLYKLIIKHEADISVCCMLKTKSDYANFGVNNLLPEEQVFTGKEACLKQLGELYLTLVTAWGKLYHNRIVKRFPFPVGKKHEDEATTCKFFYISNRVVVGNKCLYAYYQNPNSIMHSQGNTQNFDEIWALAHRAKFYNRHNEIILEKNSWKILITYLINDSLNNNYRSDLYLKRIKGRNLTLLSKVELFIYTKSHFLFKLLLKIVKYTIYIKNSIIIKMTKMLLGH